MSQKTPIFDPRGSKRGENEFLGKKRKRHVLTLPETTLSGPHNAGVPQNAVSMKT